ncbi:MAG TPA: agmatine deiminase family protein [Myxococcaceae bacterium]|jgi:agmatine deiminase|nr:agmatine deiminase family protein [Myxococcaceae bacterium]
MRRTPAALGFRMPAEWEPHAATWIAWPHERSDWPGKFPAIPLVYAEIVRWLSRSERVRIEVNGPGHERIARRVLRRAGVDLEMVDFFHIRTDRVWTRDHGPLFVVHPEGEVALTHWRFDGWAKYPNHRRDDAVPDLIARAQGRRQWKPTARFGGKVQEVVLEGGSIDVNGAGTLLTTEECLLSPVQARNPGLTRSELERVLSEQLGVRKVLWLGEGIVGDDTHGHVDDLARFVDETTVVLATEGDRTDANHARLEENRRRLATMTDADGRPLRVVALPMPRPVVWEGQRLPASYANFYIANRVVLVPTFNDPADRVALGTLARLFPAREVVGIHAVDLVWGLGTLHCLTQQEPA